ncbi:SDR family NAD(P)-dependent oxidoreductase, partial [Streptomyces sp. W16]|uniref:SDR family NAD(P)-dependent oxidoreductase n=1 Tax=Streptomyces sp. W16 TaxID=3076631 RepID=UPI00295AB60E
AAAAGVDVVRGLAEPDTGARDGLRRTDVTDPTAVAELIGKTLADHGEELTQVIYVTGAGRPARDPVSRADAELLSCAGVLHVVQALAVSGTRPPRLSVVTRDAQPVDGGSAGEGRSAVWGLVRTVRIEHPELDCLLLDLDPNPAADPADAVDELAAARDGVEIALRDGVRLRRDLVEARARDVLGEPVAVRPDGAYLVVGGLGALGLLAAERLVERGAGEVVLVGRNAPGTDARERIGRLRETGAEVHVRSADIADGADADSLFAEFGPRLRGVVHTAGVLDDRLVLRQEHGSLAGVFAPKVLGALQLERVTRELPLDFVVLYSSAAGAAGWAGQANYAAANAFLDTFAHRLRSSGRPWVSLGWGPWAGPGMAAGVRGPGGRDIALIEPGPGLDL